MKQEAVQLSLWCDAVTFFYMKKTSVRSDTIISVCERERVIMSNSDACLKGLSTLKLSNPQPAQRLIKKKRRSDIQIVKPHQLSFNCYNCNIINSIGWRALLMKPYNNVKNIQFNTIIISMLLLIWDAVV